MPPAQMTAALASPLDTIHRLAAAVLEKGGDISQLAGLLDLHKQWAADRAAEEFAEAMASFQQRVPAILKTKRAGKFMYAPFEEIMRVVSPTLTECRIVVAFSFPERGDGMLGVTCRLRVGTHAEDYPFTFPMPDPKALMEFTGGAINGPQAAGQIISYFKRYAFCAALNIVITGEDTDAAGSLETISDKELSALVEMIEDPDKAVNRAAFMDFVKKVCGADSLEQITRKGYPTIYDALKRKGTKAAQPPPKTGGR